MQRGPHGGLERDGYGSGDGGARNRCGACSSEPHGPPLGGVVGPRGPTAHARSDAPAPRPSESGPRRREGTAPSQPAGGIAEAPGGKNWDHAEQTAPARNKYINPMRLPLAVTVAALTSLPPVSGQVMDGRRGSPSARSFAPGSPRNRGARRAEPRVPGRSGGRLRWLGRPAAHPARDLPPGRAARGFPRCRAARGSAVGGSGACRSDAPTGSRPGRSHRHDGTAPCSTLTLRPPDCTAAGRTWMRRWGHRSGAARSML